MDLGAHDRRWSLAALDAGAARCIAIEAREPLVASAIANAEQVNVSDRLRFLQNDALATLSGLDVTGDAVVFCLGFFNHIMDHTKLLLDAARLGPTIVIDAAVAADADLVIRLRDEASADPRNAVDYGLRDAESTLVGVPSTSAIEAMLRQAGYSMETYDWHADPNKNWTDIEDYRVGQRITVRGRRLHRPLHP